MIAFAGLVAVMFVVVAAGGFAVSCARSLAAGDFDPCDDDDVYCPHCDSTDLDDWGEPGWWSCRPCQMLFEIKEPTR